MVSVISQKTPMLTTLEVPDLHSEICGNSTASDQLDNYYAYHLDDKTWQNNTLGDTDHYDSW